MNESYIDLLHWKQVSQNFNFLVTLCEGVQLIEDFF